MEKDSIPRFQLHAVFFQYFFALQQQKDKFFNMKMKIPWLRKFMVSFEIS